MLKTAIIVVVVVFVLIGIASILGNSDTKPLTSNGSPVVATKTEQDMFREGFIESCVKEIVGVKGAEAYCNCGYNEFAKLYTFKEQVEVSKEFARTGKFPSNFITIAEKCVDYLY